MERLIIFKDLNLNYLTLRIHNKNKNKIVNFKFHQDQHCQNIHKINLIFQKIKDHSWNHYHNKNKMKFKVYIVLKNQMDNNLLNRNFKKIEELRVEAIHLILILTKNEIIC